jgi:hypothetical protein
MIDTASGGTVLGSTAAIAAVYVWAIIDCDRLIKFFILRPGPYTKPVRVVFRLFFLTIAAGCIWGIVEEVHKSKHSTNYYLGALFVSVVVFGFIYLWLNVLEHSNLKWFTKQSGRRVRDF